MSALRATALGQMIEWAAEGKGETPPGSNLGPWVAEILKPAGLVPPEPYCASAISRAFQLASEKIGVAMPFKYSPGARNLFAQCQQKGWEVDKESIQPGDLIFWRRGTADSGLGHVGFVEYGLSPNGNIQTVEANHGSTVAHFHYDREGWSHNFIGAIRVPG
jgi:hypothetical protein